jgi:hypothetical protein
MSLPRRVCRGLLAAWLFNRFGIRYRLSSSGISLQPGFHESA